MNWRKFFRRGLTVIFILASLLTVVVVCAAIQIFDGTGQYIIHDDADKEFHEFAKQRAKQKAEENAQKKAGVYLTTFSRSVNARITDDEISAVTNKIIKVSDVKIVPVSFETDGEAGLKYVATLKATIDTDGLIAYIKRDEIDKVTIVQQNNGLQDAIAKNDALIEDLKEQYKRATSQDEKERIIKQMKQVDREFLANQKLKEGNKLYYDMDYYGAIKFYNEALQLNPNYDKAYAARGWAYHCLKQNERAIQDYNKAIELNPNYEATYNNRGIAYKNLGQNERAIQDFDKAIELNPNLYQAYTNRGIAYSWLKEYEQAIKDFNKAIEINPNFAVVYNNRGAAYALLKNFKKAIADATKAIQINPKFANAYYVRGKCYQQLGENEKAQADFAKAKELGYKG